MVDKKESIIKFVNIIKPLSNALLDSDFINLKPKEEIHVQNTGNCCIINYFSN